MFSFIQMVLKVRLKCQCINTWNNVSCIKNVSPVVAVACLGHLFHSWKVPGSNSATITATLCVFPQFFQPNAEIVRCTPFSIYYSLLINHIIILQSVI